MPRALKPCTTPGCTELVPPTTKGSRCPTHQRDADRARGTAAERGYGKRHRRSFRTKVLERDPICVRCHAQPSAHADHWPKDRDQLIREGLNPNDPAHGRGLCHSCHSVATAHHQPGGWHTPSPR